MTAEDHDAYVQAAPEAMRPALGRLRAALRDALPEAEEVIAYGMPGYAIGGSVVHSYAAFSKQCGLYVRAASITEHAAEIAAHGLRSSKTGITFPPGRPVPDDLVARLAHASRAAAST